MCPLCGRTVTVRRDGRLMAHRLEDGRSCIRTMWQARGEVCEWFALCDRPAVTRVDHPVLGSVPCCIECAGRAL